MPPAGLHPHRPQRVLGGGAVPHAQVCIPPGRRPPPLVVLEALPQHPLGQPGLAGPALEAALAPANAPAPAPAAAARAAAAAERRRRALRPLQARGVVGGGRHGLRARPVRESEVVVRGQRGQVLSDPQYHHHRPHGPAPPGVRPRLECTARRSQRLASGPAHRPPAETPSIALLLLLPHFSSDKNPSSALPLLFPHLLPVLLSPPVPDLPLPKTGFHCDLMHPPPTWPTLLWLEEPLARRTSCFASFQRFLKHPNIHPDW